jgi:hypothetical protein
MNKIILHGVGGCGISVLSKLAGILNEEIDGLCSIVYHTVDTTDKNFKYVSDKFPENNLFKVTPKKLSDDFIDGSGGDRSLNPDSIIESVKKYLDDRSYLNKAKGEIHLVIFSTSGGSGSIIGSMILKGLLEKNIPVIAAVVADENSILAVNNTVKTIKSLDGIAKHTKKPIPVFYENNTRYSKNLDQAYEDVETSILMLIQTLRTFNGDIKDIDFQDLVSLISPTNKDFELQNTIYNLAINLGDIKLDSPIKPLSIRMIKIENETILPNNLFQFKLGEITNKELFNFVETTFEQNLSLVLGIGGFKPELENLANKLSEMKNKMDIKHLYLDKNEECDSNGLVL